MFETKKEKEEETEDDRVVRESKARQKEWLEKEKKIWSEKKRPELAVAYKNYVLMRKVSVAQGNVYEVPKIVFPEQKEMYNKRQEEAIKDYQDIKDKRAKELVMELEKEAVYIDYLSQIKHLGPINSALLLAQIDDIKKFDTPSRLWTYAGLGLEGGEIQRLRKGEAESAFDMRFKSDVLRIFAYWSEKTKSSIDPYYFDLYTRRLAHEDRSHDISCHKDHKVNGRASHCKRRAIRFVAKRLLSELWYAWRITEGLPYNLKPWIFNNEPNHTHIEWSPALENVAKKYGKDLPSL